MRGTNYQLIKAFREEYNKFLERTKQRKVRPANAGGTQHAQHAAILAPARPRWPPVPSLVQFKKNPVFAGVEIELFKFFKAVQRRGGYEAVSRDRKWRDIARIVKVPQSAHANSSLAYNIRLLYQKHLLDYELYTTARRARAAHPVYRRGSRAIATILQPLNFQYESFCPQGGRQGLPGRHQDEHGPAR